MIAKYSSYVEARAYTWPVLEEHPPFESPVGLSPPLTKGRSVLLSGFLVNLLQKKLTRYSHRHPPQGKGRSR